MDAKLVHGFIELVIRLVRQATADRLGNLQKNHGPRSLVVNEIMSRSWSTITKLHHGCGFGHANLVGVLAERRGDTFLRNDTDGCVEEATLRCTWLRTLQVILQHFLLTRDVEALGAFGDATCMAVANFQVRLCVGAICGKQISKQTNTNAVGGRSHCN